MNKRGALEPLSTSGVNADWQRKSLISVSTAFKDGDWIESKDQASDGIRLIQTGNVGAGRFKDRVDKARYISEATFRRLRCEEIFRGDCLISRLPDPVGRACIIPETGERMITAVDCTIVRFDTKAVMPEFFIYYAQSNGYLNTVASKCTGTTRNRISRANLAQVELRLPSIREQARIVDILDEAFEGVERAQAVTRLSLSNSRALLDGALQSLLERDTQAAHVCLDSVCEISSMLIDPREPLYVDLPHVGAGNIESRTGVLRDVQTAREEGLISGKFVFDETMVLYSKIRPYLEKATRPDFRGLCSADMYPLKPFHGKITRDFLFYILLSRSFTQYAIAGSARSGMPKVNRDHLFKYRFRLPLVAEQNRITEKLDSLKSETERLDGIYKQKQVNLEDLKQSLLHQAFSGNL
jgi:type I restriction enzyme S subunit